MNKINPSVVDILRDFDLLSQAVIDTSTLIYLDTIGLLNRTARSLSLITIPEIKEEFGHPSALSSIQIIPSDTYADEAEPADKRIVTMAKKMNLPVLSEDKGLLMNARKNGLKYYNALMVLNFLLYKRKIQEPEYHRFMEKLKCIAHYGKDIYAFGNTLHDAIMMKKKLD